MEAYEPIEKMTLLAPHAIDWRHIPSSYQPTTAYDIAARLAKASRGASLIARVKVAGQVELIRELIHWLKVEAYKTILHEIKPIHERMTECAIYEVVDDRICRVCKGNSTIPEYDEIGRPTGKSVQCFNNCVSGKVPKAERFRYEFCGVHRDTWKRHYTALYVQILTIPYAWENEAKKALC